MDLEQAAGPSSLPPASTQRSNQILVLSLQGLPERSLTQLIDSITDGEASSPNVEGEEPNDPDGAESFIARRSVHDTRSWTIDNRYYTADVHFKIASVELPISSMGMKRASEKTKAELERLKAELEGIQAVVAVIQTDSKMGLAEHQRYLERLDQTGGDAEDDTDGDASMPIGFGLSISVVVALPAAVSPDYTRDQSSSPPPRREELIELYADHGWEYIDLSEGLTLDDADAEDDSDTGSRASTSDEGESKGLARVREALEANLWPDIVRKERQTSARKVSSRTASSFPAQASATRAHLSTAEIIDIEGDADGDDDIEAMFRKLDLNLPSMASASASMPTPGEPSAAHAEPNAQDEELARRFLASIADFEKKRDADGHDSNAFDLDCLLASHEAQASHTLPESEKDRQRHQGEALRKLEEFLQSEDGDWPSAAAGTDADQAFEMPPQSRSKLAFEDDFDEFVKAPVAQSTERNEDSDDGDEWISSKSKNAGEDGNHAKTEDSAP